MSPYEVESSTLAYDGQLSRVRVDRVRMPGGDSAEREVVEHPSAVAIVPVDDDGSVVLVRHYRHAVGDYLLELPAGKLDVSGEPPADTARRELAEEVGLSADRLVELVTFHNSAGWTDESTRVYLASGLRAAEAPDGFTPQAEEADLEVVRLPLRDAAAMAARGEVSDAKTVIGLLLARQRLGA
ncbi:MAG TPA: NUDIX hydrolase [Egibacteraceae bacterium]|nr:NUDIX hydrolase [Actinomycetota bacterium]HWB71931.1 NUDIX hydrolase [Egibacteraceae bacterium]